MPCAMSLPPPNDGSSSSVTMQQLRAFLDSSPIPTAILQWNKILYINPAGRALLGKDQAEQIFSKSILGWGNGDRLSENKMDPVESEENRRIRIQSLMRRKEQIAIPRKSWIRVQNKWIRQENRPLIVGVQAWPIPLSGGNGIQISFADITQDIQEEQAQETAK
ncbi:MAG: PAS domain-containing protein, partial [Acidobacteriaceae bacterium]